MVEPGIEVLHVAVFARGCFHNISLALAYFSLLSSLLSSLALTLSFMGLPWGAETNES